MIVVGSGHQGGAAAWGMRGDRLIKSSETR